MSERFLPSLNQVKQASEDLPDAEVWPEEEYISNVKNSHDSKSAYSITFHKIRYNSRSQGKTFRWIYKGKIMIRPSSL